MREEKKRQIQIKDVTEYKQTPKLFQELCAMGGHIIMEADKHILDSL